MYHSEIDEFLNIAVMFPVVHWEDEKLGQSQQRLHLD